ncbi:unnamed protein product [Ascophyllum nodosum]
MSVGGKGAGFALGYGVTMLVALIAVEMRRRWMERHRRHPPRRLPKTLGVSVSQFPSNPPSPTTPGSRRSDWTRSTSSQMGALQQHPSNRQTQRLGYWTMSRKLVLVMVGLPARGKSYIVKMLVRYLNWIGFPTKVFNVGEYRRRIGYTGVDKSFFEAGNVEGQRVRANMVQVVQDDMYAWLNQDDCAKVALFDATNTSKARRQLLVQRSKAEKHTVLVFIESICDDPEILSQNYRLKLQNDDYKNMDPESALKDFKERVKAYEAVYEAIEDNEDGGDIQYIKLYNVGQKVVTRNCKGYLPSQVAFYLQARQPQSASNIHISPRKIWLTRHAESVRSDYEPGEDVEELTEEGRRYSMTVAKYIQLEQETSHIKGPGADILVLSGTQKADRETIAHLQMLYPVAATPLLNEIHGGNFAGMDRTSWREQYPEMWEQREQDKLAFRFPGAGGESYQDVIQRVQPIIVELERQASLCPRSLVVVCHLAVQRCLFAYFMGVEVSKVPYIDLPMHQLTELVPSPFGTGCRHISEREMMQYF